MRNKGKKSSVSFRLALLSRTKGEPKKKLRRPQKRDIRAIAARKDEDIDFSDAPAGPEWPRTGGRVARWAVTVLDSNKRRGSVLTNRTTSPTAESTAYSKSLQIKALHGFAYSAPFAWPACDGICLCVTRPIKISALMRFSYQHRHGGRGERLFRSNARRIKAGDRKSGVRTDQEISRDENQ